MKSYPSHREITHHQIHTHASIWIQIYKIFINSVKVKYWFQLHSHNSYALLFIYLVKSTNDFLNISPWDKKSYPTENILFHLNLLDSTICVLPWTKAKQLVHIHKLNWTKQKSRMLPSFDNIEFNLMYQTQIQTKTNFVDDAPCYQNNNQKSKKDENFFLVKISH